MKKLTDALLLDCKGFGPIDTVFITGDLANNGITE